MDRHLVTDPELVRAFNGLKRSTKAPSGLVDNTWHFDLRYIHLSPPSFVLFLFSPGSHYVHQELIPSSSIPYSSEVKAGRGILYFPESAEQAAPELARTLLYAFVHGFTGQAKAMGERKGIPAFAPWSLTTQFRDLAAAVGTELQRLGVQAKSLWKIGISSPKVVRDCQTSFVDMFSMMTQSMNIHFHATPLSIRFLADDAPSSTFYNDDHRTELRYANAMMNAKPPGRAQVEGGTARIGEHMQEIQNAMALLRAKPAQRVKAEADAGDPIAAVDYGLRYSQFSCIDPTSHPAYQTPPRCHM